MYGSVAFQAVRGGASAVQTFAGQAPFVTSLVTAGTLGVGVWLLWKVVDRRRSPGGELLEHLAIKDEIAVLLHPNPDPDAMACALAVAHLATHAGTEVTIQYPGQIRHQENRAFRTVLDLDLERVETASDLAADDVVLVDHNRPRGFGGAHGVDPYAVIDHHPPGGTGSEFTDVRPEYGACASILAEYFRALGADRYGPEDAPGATAGLTLPSDLTTGLLYGIQSDTKRLSRGCTPDDLAAYSYLYPTADEHLLDRIANPLVDEEVVDVKCRAITGRDTRPPFAVSDVGVVDNLDAIPQAADELLLVEGITAVVVLGEKEGRYHMSGRSRDDRVHMGRALRTAVESVPMADAGGHARMGGGQVSIEHMNGIGPSNGLTRAEFRERLFAAMAGEEALPSALGDDRGTNVEA